ncbi:hypothetical protein QEN19_000752 [Hanseniaspora menglaensis]
MSVQNQFITFTYPAGPKDVIVTGDFCKWTKNTHLVPQSDGSFSLTLPLVHKAIKKEDEGDFFYFKFVVDDIWTIDSRFGAKVPQNAKVNQPNNYVKIDENSKRLSSFIPESVLPVSQGSNPGSLSGKKRVRVKRKVKKNKKTGETSIVSEEQEFFDDSNVEEAASSVTPVTEDEPSFSIQPVAQPETNLSLAGEPGVQIADATNPVFTEIRTVNQKVLNEKLNGDLQKENVEEEITEKVVVQKHLNVDKAEDEPISIQPVAHPETSLSLAGEPGVQIADATNPAFINISDVDQKKLNDKLNAQLVEEQKEVAEEAPVKAEEQKEVAQEVPVEVEEQKEVVQETPVKVEKPVSEPKVISAPAPKKSDGGCCVIC